MKDIKQEGKKKDYNFIPLIPASNIGVKIKEENKMANTNVIKELNKYVYNKPVGLGEIFEWILLFFMGVILSLGIRLLPSASTPMDLFIISSFVVVMAFIGIQWIFTKRNYARITMIGLWAGIVLGIIYLTYAAIVFFIICLLNSVRISLSPELKIKLAEEN